MESTLKMHIFLIDFFYNYARIHNIRYVSNLCLLNGLNFWPWYERLTVVWPGCRWIYTYTIPFICILPTNFYYYAPGFLLVYTCS